MVLIMGYVVLRMGRGVMLGVGYMVLRVGERCGAESGRSVVLS